MKQKISDYVDTCDTCQRNKTRRGKTQPPLKPLEVPTRPWAHITMDFITGLPESEGYNAILVVVDRFSKMGIFIPCTEKTDSKKTAKMLLDNVFTKHGLPDKITSDRGPQFTSNFTNEVYKAMNIENALSTAHHPQTDGQSERVNQELELYLRHYVDTRQDN